MKSWSVWIADVMSRLRRLLDRGRPKRVHEQNEGAGTPLGVMPREIEVTSTQQRDTVAPQVANATIPDRAVMDPQSSPSPLESHPTETDTPGVTTSASVVESGNSEDAHKPRRLPIDKEPDAEQVVEGAETSYTPVPQVWTSGPERSDGEIAATMPPQSAPPLRRSRRFEPAERGGRPRGTGALDKKAATATCKRDVGRVPSSRPELVCWKEGMAWVVGVEVPEDLAEQDLRVVDGEGNNLQEDHLHDLRWPLKEPLGTVTVRWSDQAVESERCFGASDHRMFKIAKSGESGRCVARVTRGNYVVIAPQALSRNEEVGGRAPVAPENVIPEQARVVAHHLIVAGEGDTLLLSGIGLSHIEVRSSTAIGYQLIGSTIKDAHTRAGPLFVLEPPHFCVEGAEEPSLFVIGVEGPSTGPRSRRAAVSFGELREWLDDNEPGWFYVRAYNAFDELLESLDFRYVKGLEAVEVDELSPLPGAEGHRPVTVAFHVSASTVVIPIDGPPEITSLNPARSKRVVLPARPDADRSTWRLSDGRERHVDVVVQVPRIWWALTASGNTEEPRAWSDRLCMLSVDDLQPTSPMHLSVLLPDTGWADEVIVGFRDASPRRLNVLRTERVLDFPLRNLGDSDILRRAGGTCDLLVSVRTPATEFGPMVVATVQVTETVPEVVEVDRLDLSCFRAPRLMSKLTLLGRIGTAQDRRAVKRIRNTWYRKARRGGRTEVLEFVSQALALAAALLEREPARKLPSRLQRHARSFSAQDPIAVANWHRWLRETEPHRGVGAGTSWGEVGQA